MLTKTIEIVISDNHYVFEAICDNDPASHKLVLVQEDWSNFCKNAKKIDLLIVCKNLDPKLVLTYKIRTIVNLSSHCIAKHEIRLGEQLGKPHKLSLLIETINKLRLEMNSLFCPLNAGWIYNEKNSCLSSEKDIINLTEKENAVFKALLLTNEHKIDKEHLLTNIWNYHQDSGSTTVDTHLYKLRQKLPRGMMNIKDNICSLDIVRKL